MPAAAAGAACPDSEGSIWAPCKERVNFSVPTACCTLPHYPGHLSHMKAKLVAFSRPSEDEGFNVKHTSVFFLNAALSRCPNTWVRSLTQSKGEGERKTAGEQNQGDVAKDALLAAPRCKIEEMSPPYPIQTSLWVPTSDLPHPTWCPV